jgi:2-polyprenyl-6-methoxyphenol hydroxylase-like FAD-dependent oxidoreductase
VSTKTVLISGASVAGPALAYWLDRYGFQVTVVERAATLRPGGQAIDFKGRIQLTVLERMGVREEIFRRQTGRADMQFLDASGRQLAVLTGEFLGGDVEILRGDLAAVFYERTGNRSEYLFDHSIAALTETADGVYVEFDNAPARTFDLVAGCDGVHSAVRRLAFGPERDYVRHLGYYYAVAGAPAWGMQADRPQRSVARACNAPGRLAVRGGSKASHLYIFAAPQLDYDRRDVAAQRRRVAEQFAAAGGAACQASCPSARSPVGKTASSSTPCWSQQPSGEPVMLSGWRLRRGFDEGHEEFVHYLDDPFFRQGLERHEQVVAHQIERHGQDGARGLVEVDLAALVRPAEDLRGP